ncbi:MFS transporter [Rhodomicrobium lacus]|uniref:MFS transporter n=1 Tax=Rhodomicrobium lacus TaxID=2498452 RepID=UPI0026E12124|nr:MFS transporter [Rhodomicrobium lacus]WKW51660.1 MFS transporter [Rhodomicrobium lacus]
MHQPSSNDISRIGRRSALIAFSTLYMLFFLAGAEMYLISPLLPLLSEYFQVPVSTAASTVTAYVLVQAVLGPLIGLGYNRFGARRLIVGGIVIFAMGNLLSAIASHFLVLVAGRAVAGLGIAIAGPASWTYIAHTARDDIRGTAIGFGMGSFALGQVAGVPLGAFIAATAGWRVSFTLIVILSLAAAMLSWYILSGTPRQGDRAVRYRALTLIWTDKSLRLMLPATFFFHAANLGAYTYLADILRLHYSLTTVQLGFIGVLSGVGTFLGANIAGAVGDRLRWRGMTESWLLPIWSLLLFVTMAVALSEVFLIVALGAILLWFVAAGAFDTNQQTLISNLAPVDMTSVALAWNMSILFSSAAFGIWLMSITENRDTNVLAGGLFLAAVAAIGSAIAARLLSHGNKAKHSMLEDATTER